MTHSNSHSQHADRVAVVTGGISGIGRGVARRLSAAGAHVFTFDTRPPTEVPDPCLHSSIVQLQVDVANESQVDNAFTRVLDAAGRVDYLIVCAATMSASPFVDIQPIEWRRTLAVNLEGTYLCCRAAIRPMISANFGRIVLLASMLARTGTVNCAAYAASKGGILGLARSVAIEVADNNVRVNTVSPGLTDTRLPRDHLSEKEIHRRTQEIPLGRMGTVDDVVEACVFLVSEESSFITGQDLRVNGGKGLW